MTRTLAFLALTIALLAPARAQAQFALVHAAPMPADSGHRIRIGIASAHRQSPFSPRVQRLSGTLLRATQDSLYLQLPVAGATAIPRAAIREVERSIGRQPRASAAELGAFVAILSAVQMMHAYHTADEGDSRRNYDTAWQAAAVGALIGFSTGAALGWSMSGERWRPAWLHP